MLRSLASWCYERRRLVLIGWIVVLIGVSVIAQQAGGELLKTYSLPGSQSDKAYSVLGANFERAGDDGNLVWKVKGDGSVTDRDVRDAIEPVMAELREQDHVVSVTSPYTPEGAHQIAPGEKIAYASILFDEKSNDVPDSVTAKMRSIAKDANSDQLQVELSGYMFVEQTPTASALIGVLAAIVILLIAFGSVLAMGLPIMTALFGIGVGLAIVQLLANPLDVPDFAPQVTEMIGIGVGIDYALFIVTRYREALRIGAEPKRAVVHAIDTSGRAVLFAGGTVVVSICGLFLVGLAFINGMAIGAALAVLFVMAASVTLLPALLGFCGRNIDKWSLPTAKRRTDPEQSFWARWSRTIQGHPWPVAVIGVLILVVLAVPVMSMRLGVNDSGTDPTKQTARRSYDLLTEGFGAGFNGPLLVASNLNDPGDAAGMQQLADTIAEDPNVQFVTPVQQSENGNAAFVTVFPKSAPQDEATTQLVHRVRDDIVPAASEGTGLDPHVGGQTATGVDLADVMGARLPYIFVTVLLLSFILLMLVFRSLLVPLKAVIMNLLSIGAAYGVMVAIFQWGWVKSAIGLAKEGPIEAWIPMMLFAIVFGLSMDYEVFLLSRIKEEYDQTGNNGTAVAHGLAKTARVITAAAAIMICVFGSFALSDLRIFKMIGFGLAFAVFIDATVVRLLLVPATMELLGDRNWWFPKWLGWLPQVQIEGEPDSALREPEPERSQPVPVGD